MSPRRRSDSPITSVELLVYMEAGPHAVAEVRRVFPETKPKEGGFELAIRGKSPGEVSTKTRTLLELVRESSASSKGAGRKPEARN